MYYLFGPMLALTGGRVLLSLHSGVGYDKWLNSNSPYHRLNKLLLPLLDRLIFMNPEESDRIRKRYPFLSERIVTVNPFIAPPQSAIPDLETIVRPAGEMKIATIGVWEQRYNVEEAVLAAVRFHRETKVPTSITVLQSTIRLEPAYKERVMAQIEAARASIEVVILEDSNSILEVLAEHDVFIRPSFLDSYGLCVAESLLVGTPAIATDVCRRCSQAMLYQQGDFDALHAHLLRAYEEKGAKRKNLLSPSEDSFHGYEREYLRPQNNPQSSQHERNELPNAKPSTRA
jgi:glycosyltransferase involved in cell wall biosynthesis